MTMSADRNVTANYVKQWAVTIQATGLTCDAPLNFYCDTGANTVATVNGTTYTGGDLSYAGSGFPTKVYIDDGGTLTYSYAWPLERPGQHRHPPDAPARREQAVPARHRLWACLGIHDLCGGHDQRDVCDAAEGHVLADRHRR